MWLLWLFSYSYSSCSEDNWRWNGVDVVDWRTNLWQLLSSVVFWLVAVLYLRLDLSLLLLWRLLIFWSRSPSTSPSSSCSTCEFSTNKSAPSPPSLSLSLSSSSSSSDCLFLKQQQQNRQQTATMQCLLIFKIHIIHINNHTPIANNHTADDYRALLTSSS